MGWPGFVCESRTRDTSGGGSNCRRSRQYAGIGAGDSGGRGGPEWHSGCGTGNVACDTETTNKVLITVDGVFQAIGAVTTVVGFALG